LVGVALLAAACSSSSKASSGASPNASGDTSASGPSGSPIKLMVMGEIQSAIYSQPEMVPSTLMAVDAINAAGGVNGHRLTIESCNTGGDNSTAIACARKAVSDKVVAVVNMATLEGAAVLPILAAAKIPAVGSEAYSPADSTSPAGFPILDTTVGFGATGQQLASVPGVKHIAVLTLDIQSSVESAKSTVKVAQAHGASARIVTIPPTATDVSSEVQNAIQGSDAIAISTPGQQAALIIPAIRQQKPSMVIGLPSGVYSQTGLGKSAVEGMYVNSATPPLTDVTDPSVSKFLADYKKFGKGNKLTDTSNGFLGWTSVQLFAKVAAGISGTIDSAAVYNAMNDVKNLNFLWLKNYTVDPSLKDRIFNKYMYLCQVKDGILVVEPGNPVRIG